MNIALRAAIAAPLFGLLTVALGLAATHANEPLPPAPAPMEAADETLKEMEVNGCLPDATIVAAVEDRVGREGGSAMLIVRGTSQAIADAWRRQVQAPPARVAMIAAYLHNDAAAVFEIGPSGCAISYTVMPFDRWLAVIRASKGEPV